MPHFKKASVAPKLGDRASEAGIAFALSVRRCRRRGCRALTRRRSCGLGAARRGWRIRWERWRDFWNSAGTGLIHFFRGATRKGRGFLKGGPPLPGPLPHFMAERGKTAEAIELRQAELYGVQSFFAQKLLRLSPEAKALAARRRCREGSKRSTNLPLNFFPASGPGRAWPSV